jgi:hypothetical protein
VPRTIAATVQPVKVEKSAAASVLVIVIASRSVIVRPVKAAVIVTVSRLVIVRRVRVGSVAASVLVIVTVSRLVIVRRVRVGSVAA